MKDDIHDGENLLNQNDADEKAQPEQTIMFQIAISKDGQVGIGGLACGDKAMAYGLMEVAKDILRDMHTPKIVKPTGGMMNFVRNGRH